jgi:hypothetical protein
MIFILNGGYSGGNVGMTPLTVLLVTSLQFFISCTLYLAVKKYFHWNGSWLFILVGVVLYELLFLLITNMLPILNLFEKDFTGFIYRSYSFSSLISAIIVLIGYGSVSFIKGRKPPL